MIFILYEFKTSFYEIRTWWWPQSIWRDYVSYNKKIGNQYDKSYYENFANSIYPCFIMQLRGWLLTKEYCYVARKLLYGFIANWWGCISVDKFQHKNKRKLRSSAESMPHPFTY